MEARYVCRHCWRSGTIGVFNSACRGPSARKVCWHRLCVLASQSADNVVHFRRLCDLSDTVTAVLLAGAPSARRITRKRCVCALDSLLEELAITISAESFRQADNSGRVSWQLMVINGG